MLRERMGRVRWTRVACCASAALALFAGTASAYMPGWYVGIEAGGNILRDAENRSRTPDGPGDPGEPGNCTEIIPGVLCVFPEPGEPGTPPAPGEDQTSISSFKDGYFVGLTFGHAYESGFRPELSLTYRSNDFDTVTLIEGFGDLDGQTFEVESGRATSFSLFGNLWYDMRTNTPLEPYIGAGVGARQVDLRGGDRPEGGRDSDVIFAYQAGAGLGFRITELLSVSLDYRYNNGQRPRFRTSQDQRFSTQYEAHSVGLALRYVFDPTNPRDSDGDGVPDFRDRCPGTPHGVTVDQHGCPIDSDGDGVPDHLDKCPGTAPGTQVDQHGCPLDSDGDGVPDHLDKCPGTPPGVAVDRDGCPLDSDGDGVPDYLDKCPDTPAGVKVDQHGCPIDSDGDGVPDYLDQCPGTPPGTPVNEFGCAVGEAFVLRGVTFEFNSARLTPNARELLDLTAEVLTTAPDSRVEVQGHTCDIGSAEYNQRLSEARARSVRDYLVNGGVSPDQLTARGYGLTQPRVSNTSETNRELNRRVELMVID